MATPSNLDARRFYHAAKQRFEDALFLIGGSRTTAAFYFAGYSVECILKALILSASPTNQHARILDEFRGATGHRLDLLLEMYEKYGGASRPRPVARSLANLNQWSTEIRYSPGTMRLSEATKVLESASTILDRADGRIS
jgi:HEPN domain-containing protein